MKYTPRPATFSLSWVENLSTVYEEFANESDAHIRMAEVFESGVKIVVFEKTTVYEVEA